MDRYISVLATIAIVLLTLGMGVGAAEVSYISGGVGADMREEAGTGRNGQANGSADDGCHLRRTECSARSDSGH